GQEVFFLTGLDEHGQKVQQAAVIEGKTPQAYCDALAADWKAFAKKLELTNDDFVRTTEPRHKKFVQAILSKLHEAGQFYQQTYKGFYSTKEETFLTDKDRLPDGTFDPAYGEVIELEEDNYYFKLRAHQQWLIDYLGANPSFVQPDYRRNEVLGFLKNSTLEDLCISRPAARLNWGIPLPFDQDFVTYVWFDALVSYISIPAAHGDATVLAALNSELGTPNSEIELWPADIHVIGKDILKFHAIFWPIMLKVMGLPLPKGILVHGWWQKDSAKISKSTGNIIDPIAVINEWGLDAFRYYVLRELDIGPDGNWTDAGFKSRYNAELANGLGNLVNRSLSMLKRYRNGVVPVKPEADEVAKKVTFLAGQVQAKLELHQLQAALQDIWVIITATNQYVDQTKPFNLVKDPTQAKRLDGVLYNLAETCRVLAVLLWPFLPGTATKIYAQLGLAGAPDKFSEFVWGGLPAGHKIGEPIPLFPRKDV
ncbi:MAG: class I tRNA ligase family protein, partial [Verrucomicrobiota bacterium]